VRTSRSALVPSFRVWQSPAVSSGLSSDLTPKLITSVASVSYCQSAPHMAYPHVILLLLSCLICDSCYSYVRTAHARNSAMAKVMQSIVHGALCWPATLYRQDIECFSSLAIKLVMANAHAQDFISYLPLHGQPPMTHFLEPENDGFPTGGD